MSNPTVTSAKKPRQLSAIPASPADPAPSDITSTAATPMEAATPAKPAAPPSAEAPGSNASAPAPSAASEPAKAPEPCISKELWLYFRAGLARACGEIVNAGPIGNGHQRGYHELSLVIDRIPANLSGELTASRDRLALKLMRNCLALQNACWNHREELRLLYNWADALIEHHTPPGLSEQQQPAGQVRSEQVQS